MLYVYLCLTLYWACVPALCRVKASEDGQIDIKPFPWDKMRLPKTVAPLHYNLFVHPNLTHLNFTGTVNIEVYVLEETRTIILHSKGIDIVNVTLYSSGNTRLLQVMDSPALEQIAFISESIIDTGVHVLSIDFEADLSESFHGFYKGTYKTKAGETRVMASTQFEPTHARQAFPCFDEPAFKANFTIRIRREVRHIVVSNMPKLRTEVLAGGLLDDYFDTSVKMSTYLVAYMICDFLSIKKTTRHGVEISVYAVPDKINQAEYALDTAVKLLDFYDDYFNIPYPLPKQDLAAIPDFQSGAMENWGLTTYRESGLLFDPEKSSPSHKLGITQVIAHELAHQWFGNLVTMQWWNDLWLNEGFAKFMEFMSVDITHPELQVNDNFLEKCFEAMEVDALSSSHPISTPVETPAQIREMFDDVSYRKGACVLSMLRDFLTPEAFKLGLIRYLRRHSYNNTVNAHLWESLASICKSDEEDQGHMKLEVVCRGGKSRNSDASQQWVMEDELDVKAIMDTWTLQEGFPMITVEVKGREVQLSQQRYLKGGRNDKISSFLWQVPLTFITSHSSTVQRFLLKTERDVLYLPEEVEWIKLNVDMRGYYIVHYEAGGWDALIRLLQKNPTALSSNDRASLINNIFQLVSIGKVSLDKALDLSLYLSLEREVMPVTQGFSELVPLYKLMEKRDMEQLENSMKGYILDLFRELIDRQEWSDEGAMSQRILRSYLLLFGCVRRHPPVVAQAEQLFQQWVKSNGTMRLPSDVTLVVYTHGARSEVGWDLLLEKYLQSISPSEKSTIKTALAFSPLTPKLQWMLEKSLEGDVLKTHDLPSLLITISRNPKGYNLSWDFMRTHWSKLISKFDLGSSAISRLVVGVTDQYSTKEKLLEVRQFFTSLSPETGAELRSIRRAQETIEENIRWMDQNVPVLKAWLESRVPQAEKIKSEL